MPSYVYFCELFDRYERTLLKFLSFYLKTNNIPSNVLSVLLNNILQIIKFQHNCKWLKCKSEPFVKIHWGFLFFIIGYYIYSCFALNWRYFYASSSIFKVKEKNIMIITASVKLTHKYYDKFLLLFFYHKWYFLYT